MFKWFADNSQSIGRTPLVKLNRVIDGAQATVLAKIESPNPTNPTIHETITGPEIWDETAGAIDILVSGLGSGGTITGVSHYIKQTKGKAIQTIAFDLMASPVLAQACAGEPIKAGPHKFQGIGTGFAPTVLDLALIDSVEQVSNEDALLFARRLAKEEGIISGISSGAAVAVATRLAKKPENSGKTIVVVLPDSGERDNWFLTTMSESIVCW